MVENNPKHLTRGPKTAIKSPLDVAPGAGVTLGVNFINPFTLYPKLLRSALNFYAKKSFSEVGPKM